MGRRIRTGDSGNGRYRNPSARAGSSPRKSSHIRALAAEGLGVVSDSRSMGLLIEALQDEDGNVQRAAARA